MGRTKEQQREYMRGYRARRKADPVWVRDFARYDLTSVKGRIDLSVDFAKANVRIGELEEEIRYLKEELAKRPKTRAEAEPQAEAWARRVTAEQEVALAIDAAREKAAHDTFSHLPEGRVFAEPGFNTRPFTPVPKKGH